MEKKRKKVVGSMLALAVLVVFSLMGYAGSLEPTAPPGPTMKTLDEVEPRVPIHASDLPLTITEPNSYYLVENINFTDDANHAITIECNDVTIDLMGYTLEGPDSGFKSGIYMNGCANVEIRNGTIRDFGQLGIYEENFSGANEHRVINVRVTSNGAKGIWLTGNGNVVKNCTLTENGDDGIRVGNASIVTGNTVRGSNNRGHGIYVVDFCTVAGNKVYENEGDGIQAHSGCTIIDNMCDDNGHFDGAGIQATGNDNHIERNNLTNTDRGLEIEGTGNIVAENIVKGNTDNYDIAAGNQLNILLCEVPETIDWPATVTLAGSLKLTSTTEHAITVDSNDVTVDLAGFSLIGPDSGIKSGIYMNGRTNVEVRNGTARDFYYGIREASTSGKQHRVINVRAMSNAYWGIYLSCYGSLVKDCTAAENGGVGIRAVRGSTVTGNTASDNGDTGIYTDFGCTVTGNTASDNGNEGIYVTDGCTVTGNTAYGNEGYGIQTSNYCLIDQNTACSNGTNMTYGAGCQVGLNVAP